MSQSKGFSLVELSVALFIIALLLGGALIPLSTQVDVRNTAETRRNLDSIREAIIGFAQANGRLPCPAAGTVPAGGTDAAGRPAGVEQLSPTTLPPPSTAVCANSFGVVPWTTLGVPETDSWGRRFSYWVSPIFADGIGVLPATARFNNTFPGVQNPDCTTPVPAPTLSSFALCSLGSFTVNTRKEDTHAPVAIGLVLPAVIISHGKNGNGAYTPKGSTLAAPTGADEIANATHTGAPAGVTTFFSRNATPSNSPCSDAGPGGFCEFDDIVVMISSSVLMSRMVAAGKLP
jgi:prepilin-type N-terminal cleavage/methylation domain-containing protein